MSRFSAFHNEKPLSDGGQPSAGETVRVAPMGERRSLGKEAGKAIAKRWKDVWSVPGEHGRFLGWPAAIFILTQLLFGIPLLPYALLHWQSENMLRFTCFLGVALAASLFKVRLPGIQATMSANFLF